MTVSWFVADASTIVSSALPDESPTEVFGIMARIERGEALAPAHWPLEVVSAVRRAARRGRLRIEVADVVIHDLLALPVHLEPVDPQTVAGPILELMDRHGLTVYDAAYLELAARRRVPLATRDGRLAAAARAERVEVA